jgi:HK97 family phage major capsid protein
MSVKKTVAEQIADLENTRAAKAARMEEVMQKSLDEGRSTDQAEAEEVDTITGDIQSVDEDLVRLKNLQKIQQTKAAPVNGKDTKTSNESRSPIIQVKDNRVRGDGIGMAQLAKCLFKAQGNLSAARDLAEENQSLDPRVAAVLKTAVAAGTTSSDAWAGNLVGDETSLYADFLEYLRPQTIIGKFGTNGIPSLFRVPFRVPLLGQTSGGAGYWVGEGNAKPLTKFDFSRTTLSPLKVANIAILTEEVVRDSSPNADAIVRDQLVKALASRLDIDFVDPDKAASAGISPASITNGVTEISSSGSDAAAVRRDIRALWAPFIAANNPPTTAVYIMSATTALALSLMVNALGQPEFPGITMNGGTFNGVPVIVSEHLANNGGSSGAIVILVNAGDIYFGDEGGFQIDLSREASVQMDDAPDNPSSASTVLVSLWQRNLVGFRAERTVSWARRGTASVSWLGAVSWA